MLIVASKVKEAAKGRIGADALQALSDRVEALVKKARQNAVADNMETIKAKHIPELGTDKEEA